MKRFLHLIILCLLNGMFYANTKPTLGFIENKGQIHDQNFKPNTEVKYLLCVPGMNIQLKQNSFSYDTYSVEQKNTETTCETPLAKLKRPAVENTYHFHRVDVEFIGASAQPEIIAESPSETYYNYYTTGTSEQGATNVRSYEKITYKNIYPNIDLEFIAKDGKMKYNFILHYGADMNVIKWKYYGANTTEIENNNISIAVKQGEFKEAIPESFISYNGVKCKNLIIKFKEIEKNTYCFSCLNTISIKRHESLIIDPTLILLWSTYLGGLNDEFLQSSCIDVNGNTYHTGSTSSTNAMATTGAFQNIYGGGLNDVTISKFNSNGVLIWGTYFGNLGDDQGYSIQIDKSNNLFVSGCTSSTVNLATTGAHQTAYGGGIYDGFLIKLTNSGFLTWGTYFGGNGEDCIYACSIDSSSNSIYGSGYTSSSNNISTIGSFMPLYGGGPYDAFIVKFNFNGVRQWSTYYGDYGDDEGSGCAVDYFGNVYLAGGSTSSISIATPGSFQVTNNGSFDVFIARFNTNGVRLWGTYLGGNGNDMPYSINYENKGKLVLTGFTKSTNSISTFGSYQFSFGGGSEDAFISMFDTIGAMQWSTYYGGNDFDYGYKTCFDSSSIYVCGCTRSSSGISTSNCFQTNYGGGAGDGFIVKFSKNGVRQWGTYYGTGGYDPILSIVKDNQNNYIYTTGYTSSGFGFATSGSHQNIFGGGVNDGFVVKFRENNSNGLIESELSNSVKVFPNPNNGVFYIQIKEDVVLEIINELGQLVKTIKLDAGNNHQANITGLADGVYCLKDKLSGTIIKNKIVVVR